RIHTAACSPTRTGSAPKARVWTIGFLGSRSRSHTGANAQLIPTERASVPVIIPQAPVASRSSSQPSAAGGGSSESPCTCRAGAAGAGRSRQVSRFPEDREKAKERKHQSLLGFPVEKEAFEPHHRSRGHPGGEQLDQSRIARAPARDHELVGRPSGRPALDPATDG